MQIKILQNLDLEDSYIGTINFGPSNIFLGTFGLEFLYLNHKMSYFCKIENRYYKALWRKKQKIELFPKNEFYFLFAGTWMLIGDSQDPVWRWSAHNASSTSGTRVPRGPLSTLQEGLHRTAGSSLSNPRLPHSAPCVVSYLEQQLLASKALGSSQEYVHWLMALVSFLLTQGLLQHYKFSFF